MANMLIPVEERHLTPQEVEALAAAAVANSSL